MRVYEVRETRAFEKWLAGLRNPTVRARIVLRLQRVRLGLLGDHRFVGERVSELRVDAGPGYRLYFVRQGEALLFLCGGDKSSQQRDIERAKVMARAADEDETR